MYQRKRKEKRYYPTRLAINLTSGVTGITTQAQRKGFIMVETNYRIYAYTGIITSSFMELFMLSVI